MSTSIVCVVEVYDPLEAIWRTTFDLEENPDFPDDSPQWVIPALVRERFYEVSNTFIYTVLGWSGGRRSGQVPISPLLGLPKDVSQVAAVLAEQDGDYGYDHSYLTLAEMEAYAWQDEPAHDFHMSGRALRDVGILQPLLALMADMAALGTPDAVRLVFWFTT